MKNQINNENVPAAGVNSDINMKRKILITGATGATGSQAVNDLMRRNIPVRAFVHKIDDRSEKLRAKGVEIAVGDLSDFEAVSSALEGISGAYFVYPVLVPGILEATAYFAQAALEQGVGSIVNMSQVQARRTAKSHHTQNHWIAERLLDRSGVPVTHLRPTFFAEWLTYQAEAIKHENILPLPFGDGRYAPIAAEDQGRVIGAILSNPSDHAGKIYPLYGREELSQYQIVEMLSNVLGKKITYVPMEIEAFGRVLKDRGYSSNLIQHISVAAQECRDGLLSGTNDFVEKLTGQRPVSMVDYIIRNQAIFK